MSGLAIDCLLILWSLHTSLHCCETGRETDLTTCSSLGTKDSEGGQLRYAEAAPETLAFLTAPICSRDRV